MTWLVCQLQRRWLLSELPFHMPHRLSLPDWPKITSKQLVSLSFSASWSNSRSTYLSTSHSDQISGAKSFTHYITCHFEHQINSAQKLYVTNKLPILLSYSSTTVIKSYIIANTFAVDDCNLKKIFPWYTPVVPDTFSNMQEMKLYQILDFTKYMHTSDTARTSAAKNYQPRSTTKFHR